MTSFEEDQYLNTSDFFSSFPRLMAHYVKFLSHHGRNHPFLTAGAPNPYKITLRIRNNAVF